MDRGTSWLGARFTLALWLLPMFVAGCGAKTGLEVPDTNEDAGDLPDAFSADAGVPCIELLPDAGPVELPLDTQVEVGRADVVFVVDTTQSMQQEIDQIRDNLRDQLAPGIRATIRDSQLGVASFRDFPSEPCGDSGDVPFTLNLPVTSDIGRVQAALRGLTAGGGNDNPEAQVEALFQVATGAGRGSLVPPSFGCPSGGFGYPCFRDDALPVVLLFTDAAFHDGPLGLNPYTCALPVRPARYREAVDALNARGVRVMGLYSGMLGDGREDLDAIARDTNALDASGNPIVFDIGVNGTGLSESVVQAIRTLASVIELDIDTVLVDPNPRDAVDPRNFVDRVIAVRGEPMSGVGSIERDAGIFRRVRTGTRLSLIHI